MNRFQTNFDIMESYREEADNFKGDKALFWAGKMAYLVGELERKNIEVISQIAHLLRLVKDQYNCEIINQMK